MELPITGPGWQVMRVSRNRYWGNPNLIAFIERLANHAKKIGWNGILIGDLSQPRGGPMFTGHTSHQIGLDVDIWFTPAPDQELSKEEREFNLAQNMVSEDRRDVDPKVWTSAHTEVVRAAAEDGAASRIFVNPAIKKAMCREAGARSNRNVAEKLSSCGFSIAAVHRRGALTSRTGSLSAKPKSMKIRDRRFQGRALAPSLAS